MSCPIAAPSCLPPIKRGDTWLQTYTWLQNAGTVNEEPVDLTGCHASLQLRKKRVATPYLTISDTEGSLVIDGATGTITQRVEADDMASVPPGDYYADLQVVFPGTPTTTLSSQTFLVPVVEDQTQP